MCDPDVLIWSKSNRPGVYQNLGSTQHTGSTLMHEHNFFSESTPKFFSPSVTDFFMYMNAMKNMQWRTARLAQSKTLPHLSHGQRLSHQKVDLSVQRCKHNKIPIRLIHLVGPMLCLGGPLD